MGTPATRTPCAPRSSSLSGTRSPSGRIRDIPTAKDLDACRYISARELIESIRRQVESLVRIASRMGARVTHVKMHGALYNQGERDATVARNIIFGVQAATSGHELVIVAPPGSAMAQEASGMGMKVARE